MDALVSTSWLAGALGSADLRILDASLFLPDDGRDAYAEFAEAHIPGARPFDIKKIADRSSELPNMMPTAAEFTAHARALGVNAGDRVVVYDNSPHHSAMRAWWMLRAFGHRDVAVLDGGLAKWRSEGHPIESGEAQPGSGDFTATEPSGIRNLNQMRANLDSKAEQVVDARSAARFAGSLPEPRAGLEPGHIPGSVSLPQTRLFNPDGSFKQGDALKAEFDKAGVDLGKPIVTTCGSGVTAAVVGFGALRLGARDVSLYDGSWTEWGSDSTTPKATGAA